MGLTSEQALKYKEEGKYNGNVKAGTKTVGEIFRDNIFTFFNAVNLVAALFVFSVGSYKNMTFMFVCFWNAIVGISQEMKARRTLTKLKILLNPIAYVIRDDKEIQIKSDDIVYNDTCVFYAGDQVCVDGKVIDGEGFVNESLLTGESIPVPKKKDDEVLAGTFVAEGKLVVLATGVGEESYTYKIIKRAKKFKKNRSEIMYSINYVIRLVTLFVIPVATALVLKQYFFNHDSYSEIVLSTVAATIGFIPSGFVLLTSLVMFKGAVKLSFYNTLVQDLYSTEKLARVDTICFDKTGTLTKGRFDVTKIVPLHVSSEEIEKALAEYSHCGFDRNSTILSIRAYYSGRDTFWTFKDGIAFSSAKKWSLLEFEQGTFVLGAPDVLLDDKEKFNSLYNNEIKDGARIVAFGKCDSYDKEKEEYFGFNLWGLVILKDTLRDNAKETIKFLESQKLDIKVISGDNPLTASLVAKEVGIKNADKYIDASKIDDMDEIKEAVSKYTVFGRVTPEFKLKFVRALQEQEHVVAMTGDGVNDVMALKEADCSIAMQSGSSAARDISSVVLLDSDFAHIPEIIREGRRSINNLERSGVLYLTKTVYAILLALLFIVLPFSYPFKPIQYTLIGTLTIGYPSFFLAFEPNDERVRTGFLYNILFKAIPNGCLVATNVCLSALMVYLWLGSKLGSELTVSTMATLTTGLVSVFIFTDLCLPFTKLRFWVTLFVPIVFWLVLLIVPGIFDVMGITVMRFYGSVIILLIDFLIYLIYRKLTRKFFNKDKFRARITNWLNKKARKQAKM